MNLIYCRNNSFHIGVIGHGQWLYEELTAEENLRFFAQLYNVEDPGPKIEAWLEDTGLARFRKSRVDEFSRQRFGRVLAARRPKAATVTGWKAGRRAAQRADLGRRRMGGLRAIGSG